MTEPRISTDKFSKLLYKDLTEKIIKAAYKVHNILGTGYLEVIYQNATLIELKNQALNCDTEKLVEIFYQNQKIGEHRLDLVVENKVILELKSVNEFHPFHQAQVISYLKATGMKVALLINFGKDKIEYKRYVL